MNDQTQAPAQAPSLGQLYADALHAFDQNSDEYLRQQFEDSLQCQPVGQRGLEKPPELNPDGSVKTA